MNSIGPYVCPATVAAGGIPGPAPAELAPPETPKTRARRALWPFGTKVPAEAEMATVLAGVAVRRAPRAKA